MGYFLLGLAVGVPVGVAIVLIGMKLAEIAAFRDYWGP